MQAGLKRQYLPAFLEHRQHLVEVYRKYFQEIPEIDLTEIKPGRTPAHHLFIIRVKPETLSIDRDDFARALKAENVGIGFHFRSLHILTYYRERFGFKPEDFPVAYDITNRIISLPLMVAMTDEDVHSVVEAVKKLLHYYRKTR